MHRYYLTQRPPSLGTIPKGAINIKDYNGKILTEEIGFEVWGYAEYDKPLTPKQICNYELMENEN